MHIVFLSGGSGKRLWPMSNETRSKQFLQLLPAPNGGKESIIQRVVRQVREANLTNNLVFATNTKQKDSIVNQIGDDSDIVTEPERRDTFPAIALAAGHLIWHKHCADNEVVVVMPCDVYTDDTYFVTIGKMAKAVKSDVADMVLMGITPTYASEKFGYIVPQKKYLDVESLVVDKFTEKPNECQAKELVDSGALWNGGVFAFKLGYLRSIIKKYMPSASSFEYIFSHYNEFPKISFDYEVVEKASSVAVIPFVGLWRDLGTWNAFCEELSFTIGNVFVGKHNENTHIINELGIPIFCDGLKNAVVVASSDGILVCGKKESEKVKYYANELVMHTRCEACRSGTSQVLNDVKNDGIQSLTERITLKAGADIAYQIHHHSLEIWTICDGEGCFVLDGNMKNIKRGDVLIIPQEHYHAIKAQTELIFIKVQIGTNLIEEDIRPL